MGRGRTTTGMVIATLVYLNRIGASGIVFAFSILPHAYDAYDILPHGCDVDVGQCLLS